MLDGKAFKPRRKTVQLHWGIAAGQFSLLFGQPFRPVRVFGFRSNPRETKLPSDQKRVLLAVGPFAAECRLILAPRSHHGFAKSIGDSLAKLFFNEPPVPSRRPAFPARTLDRLPQIPGRVLGAVYAKYCVWASRDLAPKRHPTRMGLRPASFGLLGALRARRLHPAQFGAALLGFQAVINDRCEARHIQDERLKTFKEFSMIGRAVVEQEHFGP